MGSKTPALAFALLLGCSTTAKAAGEGMESFSTHYLNCNAPLGYHFTKEQLTCPIGGETFDVLQLGTHSTFGMYLDRRPVSYLGLPGPLPVCPKNGMVVTRPKYTDEELKKIGEALASEEYKKIYAGQQATYFLYAEQSRLAGFDDPSWGVRWQQLVSATWEADVCRDKEKYKAYATAAIAEMQAAFTAMTPKDEFYWTVGLLIPEMQRRLGDFDAAKESLLNLGGDLPEDPEQKKSAALMIDVLKVALARKDTNPVEVKEKYMEKEPVKKNPVKKKK
ncbi:MAG: hypothetical protein ACAH80_11620 [Alphaproteobacteria bacterium]